MFGRPTRLRIEHFARDNPKIQTEARCIALIRHGEVHALISIKPRTFAVTQIERMIIALARGRFNMECSGFGDID